VVSASSDLVPIHDPVYEQTILSADVVPEVAGTLWLGTDPFGPDDAPMPVTARQSVPVRLAGNGAHLRAVLRTSDGRFGVSEVSLTDHNLPASPTGEIVSVWPAVDQGALDLLQQDADEGRRPDLLEPVSVAAAYLSALLPRDSSATPFPFHVGNFRQGDPTSGEVPFDLDGVEAGSILVRRDGEGGIWHVDTVASTGVSFAGVELVGEGTFSVRIVAHLAADRANWQTDPGGSDISEGVQLGLMAPGDTAEIRVATAGRPHWVQVVLRSNDRIVAIGVERLP
jgi:hypothetical protein